MNIVFLASGGGGNLRFVEAAIRKRWLPDSRIVAVIADRQCASVDFARSLKIDASVRDFSPHGQLEIIRDMEKWSPSAIITNVHKILSNDFVGAFRNRLLNLHYSLLPAFQGTIGVQPVRQAMAYGAKFVGVTVHQVDEGVDTGRPLAQVAIPVKPSDEELELMDVVFRCGCLSLLTGLNELLDPHSSGQICGVLPVKGRNVIFNPVVDADDEFFLESFWDSLRTQ